MAVDAYLQIEGIKGESQDAAHKDWIECLNVHFGVDQPRSPVTSTSGGHTSARADFDDVVVPKLADLSTPLLLQHCAMGLTPTGGMQEHFRLKFAKVTWKYTQQKISGGAGGSTAGGWDLSTNKVAA